MEIFEHHCFSSTDDFNCNIHIYDFFTFIAFQQTCSMVELTSQLKNVNHLSNLSFFSSLQI